MLHRTVVGNAIKSERLRQGKTLRQVAEQAPLALGYLSEVERGQKELSSELLEGVLRSLGMSYLEFLWTLTLTIEVENQRLEEYELA